MRFYTTSHRYYCGIDPHARRMYICVLDAEGKILVHRNGAVEVAATSGLQELKLQVQRSGRGGQVAYRERLVRSGRVRKDRDAAGLADSFYQQLQAFAVHANAEGQPGDIPARARQARDDAEPNRIANALLAFHVAEVAQPLPEGAAIVLGGRVGTGARTKKPDPGHPRQLRVAGPRRGENG